MIKKEIAKLASSWLAQAIDDDSHHLERIITLDPDSEFTATLKFKVKWKGPSEVQEDDKPLGT